MDTEPVYLEVNQRLYRELGIAISPEEQLGFIGISGRRIWGILREKFHFSPPAEELYAREKAAVRRELERRTDLAPFPGVVSFLSALKSRRAAAAVASSSSRNNVEYLLSRLGLAPAFDAVVTGDDCAQGKPAPDLFLLAAERLGRSPAECLVVEDSPPGIAAARAAGMFCVAFRSPHTGAILPLPPADLVIDDFCAETRERVLRLVDH